jgi:hypothetical protein
MDDLARFLVSALTLRVFFITCLISVCEVAMPTKLQLLLEKEAQLKAQILVGAAVLARVERGEWPQQDLNLMMDGFLSRPLERELFGLDVEAGDKADEGVKMAEKKGAKGKTVGATTQANQKAPGRLAEPDIDLDKEFNL